MSKSRIEAFSDGVLAIVITIMVLELKVPTHADRLVDLRPLLPVFSGYVLSFVYLAIYWNNHHHLFQAMRRPRAGIMWANLHLLFWLSLFPFATGWMGENGFARVPTALYGFVLLMAALAYLLLQRLIVADHGADSPLARAFARDWKGWLSPLLYLAALPLSFLSAAAASGLYVAVALLWLVPDRRIERALAASARDA